MRLIYQSTPDGVFDLYRCPLSGRCEFDLTEAANKARWLVQNGKAVDAIVLNEGQIAAQWQRKGDQATRISGPDL